MNVIKFRKRFSRIDRNFNATSRNTGFTRSYTRMTRHLVGLLLVSSASQIFNEENAKTNAVSKRDWRRKDNCADEREAMSLTKLVGKTIRMLDVASRRIVK